MSKFSYLNNDSHPNDSVLLKYTEDELKTKFIFRNSETHKYYVGSINIMEKWYNEQPEERMNFHEIIIEGRQKIKFDIDYLGEKKEKRNIIAVMYEIIDVICQQFKKIYSIPLLNKNILVYDSSGVCGEKYKFSYHIIIKYAVENTNEAKLFTKQIKSNVSSFASRIIDSSVNSKNHGLRILHSQKDGRIKKLTCEFNTCKKSTVLDSLVRWYPSKDKEITVLPTKEYNITYDTFENPLIPSNDNNSFISTILSYIPKDVLDGFQFDKIINDQILTFRRLHPSYCSICDRTHESENSLMILYTKERIIQLCRRSDGSRTLKRFELEHTDEKEVSILENIINSPIIEDPLEFMKLKDKNVYSERYMREYEHKPTLVVKGQMSLGKSKQLLKYIDKYYDEDSVVRILTFRRAFTNSLRETFPHFHVYDTIKGEIKDENYKKLIIQMESLHRLNLSHEHIDLLILDEVESIFAQFNSGLYKHFNQAFAVFEYLLQSAKHVVCIDAHVGNRTYRLLKKMRPDHNIFFHWNKHKQLANSNYHFTLKENTLIAQYIESIKTKKVIVATNSLQKAKLLYEIAEGEQPKKKIMLYSSETCEKLKKEHLSDVNKHWAKYDILIYTPTITAGISFEKSWFDEFFGFFSNNSCPVETCIQMIGRVRNIKSNNLYICLHADYYNFPDDAPTIERHIYLNKQSLFLDELNCPFVYKYSPKDKQPVISCIKTNAYHLMIENTIINNKSKNNFIKRFINYIKISAHVSCLEDPEGEEIEALKNLKKGLAEEIKEKHSVAVANADEIDSDEVITLADKDVTESEKLSLAKFQLRKKYDFWDNPITPEFVTKYYPLNVKNAFENLTKILSCATIKEGLNQIQHTERQIYKSNEEFDISHINNLVYDFEFIRHKIALDVMYLAGFKSFFDSNLYPKSKLFTNIINNYDCIKNNLKDYGYKFKLSVPNIPARISLLSEDDQETYLNKLVRLFSRILHVQYLVKIVRQKNHCSLVLEFEEYFSINKLSSEKPCLIIKNTEYKKV